MKPIHADPLAKFFLCTVLLLQGCAGTPRLDQVNNVYLCAREQCGQAGEKYDAGSMFNGIYQLFRQNEDTIFKVCEADPSSHACTEDSISYFVLGGPIPGKGSLEEGKIAGISVDKRTNTLETTVASNMKFIGTPLVCADHTTVVKVLGADRITLEDSPYYCNWMAVGNVMASFNMAIDYVDLDKGRIGGYYTHAVSGTGIGKGSGYALLRFPIRMSSSENWLDPSWGSIAGSPAAQGAVPPSVDNAQGPKQLLSGQASITAGTNGTSVAKSVGPVSTFEFPSARTTNQDAVAVIIGNRNYEQQKQGVPNVNYAHNDADLLRRYVIEGLGYREGNVIDLRDATQSSLISTFGTKDNPRGKLSDWVRPGKSDVFVYYSGHGAPSLADGKGYLLPVDADPQRIDLVGYPLETLFANLGKIPAKSLTVIIDACFSGNSQTGMVIKNASPAILKVVEMNAALPNATVITAAGVSEVASWDEESKHGLFTRYFLEGVTGKADTAIFGNKDGKITLGELKNYLYSEVAYMARRLYGREQHPQVVGRDEQVLAGVN